MIGSSRLPTQKKSFNDPSYFKIEILDKCCPMMLIISLCIIMINFCNFLHLLILFNKLEQHIS